MSTICWIVAGDPEQYTGGYIYDARIVAALREQGHTLHVVGLAGRFPVPDDEARQAMDRALTACSDGRTVVIDGLALGGLGDIVARHRPRLIVVALVHHPLAEEAGLAADTATWLAQAERNALAHVDSVIVTSPFTARRLCRHYGVDERHLAIVAPGVAPTSGVRPDTRAAGAPLRLLCVASLIPRKGHDVLIAALARVQDLDWVCDCIGDDARDPAWTRRLGDAISRAGLDDRIRLLGARPPERLSQAYAEADLFVLASHYEGYGMVITEALVHGLPVITTTGGALADTLPDTAGLGVAPGDVDALADAIRALLRDTERRSAKAEGARRVAKALPDWSEAGADFARALTRFGVLSHD